MKVLQYLGLKNTFFIISSRFVNRKFNLKQNFFHGVKRNWPNWRLSRSKSFYTQMLNIHSTLITQRKINADKWENRAGTGPKFSSSKLSRARSNLEL